MAECIFCNTELIKEDILWQSKNFFAKVGLGILAPGHIMLITKSHIRCFGDLPANLDKEFLAAKEKVFEAIKSNFSEPLVLEHGVYNQSVKHAHLHFIPKKSRLYSLENIAEKVFTELESEKIDRILRLKDIYRKEGSYIYLEDGKKKVVFHTKGIPKGKFNFRKEFAMLTGVKGLEDWREMGGKEKERDAKWISITKEGLKQLKS